MGGWFSEIKKGWSYNVKKGDYIMVISNTNEFDKRLMKITRVTKNSIFLGKIQFSKFTKSQKNNQYRIEPFLAHHIKQQDEQLT